MTPGGLGKTYAFGFLLAGTLLMGWNYRRRQRVGVLRAHLSSNEFASLLVAMTMTTLAFSALALFPLMQHRVLSGAAGRWIDLGNSAHGIRAAQSQPAGSTGQHRRRAADDLILFRVYPRGDCRVAYRVVLSADYCGDAQRRRIRAT